MKAHTAGFKNGIKELGRQLRAVITYGNTTLEEEIYSISPHFEANILKSVMKQLDVELSVDIPLETVINCQIGILVNGNYEMLNYGNYVVYKSEKKEDTNTYNLTCYDKILYSMKQNEDLGISYPITIKNYLTAVVNKIGLTLKTTTFQNASLLIQNELYAGLEYTYRDILDELAEVTGSIICLNENDEVIVKYPTQTNDTINEEFLKDVNVDFGQKYGVINSIVLSRSGESDNVYLRDEQSVQQNGLTEVKIVDNQIMNFNDRSDYLQGILNALDGLYYYLNDFSSTGIMYYEVGDLYNVQIGENTYQCLMLNDDLNITTGIEELIHTDLAEQSETDYTKADKTDRRINQTYLIVDKQNQQIESLITTQTDQNQKIARVTQTVDELNSKISDIADITTSLESNSAEVEFTDINQSEPIRIVVHPLVTNIARLHPHTGLKPRVGLKLTTRTIRFTNTKTDEVFEYEIPADLLYYDSENYDEFILDYDSQTCIINKKCKWNDDGSVGLLSSAVTVDYTYPRIELTDGDYTVQLIQYNTGYLFVRLMAQNIYTTQFATKAEVNSDIRQTVDNINLSVNERLANYSTTTEMNSAIDLKANEITSSVSENYATKSELNSSTSSLNSKIDQTAESISLTVNNVQEQVETAQSTADTATTKANNAQTSANNINNNLTTNYYTKTQTNSAINQKANEITSTVSATYSTKTETANAIDGIEIGGNNLVSNSADNWQAGNWSIPEVGGKTSIVTYNNRISLKEKIEIEPNTEYWVKIYSPKTVNVLFRVCNSSDNFIRTVSEMTDQKWTSGANDKYIHITIYDNSVISDIANGTTKLKIEKGNKPSAWSPSFIDYSTTLQMNSAITQKANEITSQVSETYATKTITNSLSTRIKQTAKSIELTAKDNGTSSGITIKLKNEDGTQIDSKTANITLSGLVKFTDLSTSGSTTINGSNITTGTINANLIKTGTLSADRLNGGTITGSSINLGNGKFTVNTSGVLTATSGKIGGWGITSTNLSKSSNNYEVGLNSGTNSDALSFYVWDKTNNRSNFYVRTDGYMYARNADISGTITATSGTFQNCTITNSCTVPAGTISGTLATNNIPNLSASKITTGTMSGDRVSGGIIWASEMHAMTLAADYVSVNTEYGHFEIGDNVGQNFQLIVNDGEKGWRRLTFKGGILVNVEENW